MADLPRIITASINLEKIDKAHIIQGDKGKYLSIALLVSENDQYGNDYMVVQSVSKEARESGAKGPILGNGKTWGQKAQSGPSVEAPKAAKKAPAVVQSDSDDLPF